ncbi:hypothetical protein AGABI1DRAFT_127801 [Agaricus bisporus var. burnettii JB137-S8]|nr:uncharacterized protein AGABI1DRAFT_127801 [Agaricus bisporus var. burnettii JB137-S8]EKM80122.1 hypothetical protein AGABI1DRAFT_127801 [Agaricus bisporus var. burnettii JB137-S8]
MEFIPRYAQPFTLNEAIGLDVSVIVDEIARLQNSLKHLRETQTLLREFQSQEAPGTADPEVQKALEENEVVIGSQTERITILRMALAEKGVGDGRHYDASRTSPTGSEESITEQRDSSIQTQATDTERQTGPEDGGGIHL